MNAITTALQESGYKIPPQMQRVWLWVKDHPAKAAREVEAALGFPGTSSILAQMQNRGMVTVKLEFDRHARAEIKRFTAVGESYELKPVQKKAGKPAPTAAPKPAAAVTPIVHVEKAPPETPVDIEAMTVADARKLYKQLHKMFGA